MSMEQIEILIVEDEPKIAELLEEYLQTLGGFNTYKMDRGDKVLGRLREAPPDLILLDLMLPGLDGIEVCKQVRAESAVPIIMVTARVEEIDRLIGLELGADDYICKPFSPREVVARAKTVLRRTRSFSEKNAPAGLLINEQQFSASIHGQRLELTAVEFALLKTLARYPGRVYSRDQLMNEMYSDYRVVTDRAVDTHIKNLRRKLASAAPGEEFITSVYGMGYRIEINTCVT